MNRRTRSIHFIGAVCLVALLAVQSDLWALTVNVTVQEPNGAPVDGYRWLIEEDTTNYTAPGVPVADSISLDIHNSYAPVALEGHSATSVTNINDVNVPSNRRYFLSVLPYTGFTMGGAAVDIGQTNVTVIVHPQPIPTAQISVLAFVDHGSINNVYDAGEQGLGGATIIISELGGQQMTDAFGNMLGTTYLQNPDGSFILDGDGMPMIDTMGPGYVTTLTQEDFDADNNPYNLKVGEALIKNIAPGKYGVIVIPPPLDDNGDPIAWSQTATIEGTPTVDAWVKANEPKLFVEGFGTGFNHCFFGFVKAAPTADSSYKGQTFSALPWNVTAPGATGSIQGRLRLNHFSRPPMNQGFWAGDVIGEGWVGLNDPASGEGLYAAPCSEDGTFVINNVPAGTYELVTWDTPLDNLFGFHAVTVGEDETVDLGDVLEFRWFGTFEGTVFLDNGGGDPNKANNGFPDPGEPGILEQNVNIRFRDGTIYQAQPTDTEGGFALEEVFPFFKWLVIEVDFARFKATGLTVVVDGGGEVQPHDDWNMPSYDKLNPQPQVDANGVAVINPNTGNNLSRTEVGEVLTQAMHLFLNQTNVVHFGKNLYEGQENGGISGVVFYATTRAEDDPRYAVGEPWEPGIPRVQMNLYLDTDPKDGVIDDIDGNPGVTLADVDNYPFQWAPIYQFLEGGGANPEWSGTAGPEDEERNGIPGFQAGDAIQITTTDSWDDNKPTGSIGPDLTIHGQQVPLGMDQYATWNQIRPGVFDGGYAFNSYVPGGVDTGADEVDGLPTNTYIVESTTPPGYELVKEEDKNVDFGDEYVPSPELLPPICVGDPHPVPSYLSFQTDEAGTPLPGIDPADLIEAPYAGLNRPLADRKQVVLSPAKNAAADFFYFTKVPKAARGVGFVNNDLGAEFNQWSPNFGEKIAPKWIPISLRDWTGREFHRIYCDEFGCYNFVLHSTFSINVPAPSGVAPHMMTLVLNDPILPDGSIDPYYNPIYSITPWTLQYYPGTTSYLDTPLVPLAAFSAADLLLDTEPNNTPVIASLDGPGAGFGPVIQSGAGGVITLQSKGTVSILNPAYDSNVPGSPFRVDRNYGFGTIQGQVLLDDTPLTVNSWTDATIEAVVPAGATTGRITVVRGDNQTAADVGVTLHVVDIGSTIIHYVDDDGGADFVTIQDAIDAAAAGDLILVAPGVYNENVIMNKPVRLQGSGSGGTTIFGYPNPAEKLTEWHNAINALAPAGYIELNLADAFGANETPAIIVIGQTDHDGTLINPGFPFGTPGQALIDGFTCSGSKAGGGIFAAMGASNLTISNNNITGNQGNSAGGISIGYADANFDLSNANVAIRWNKVHKNGGLQGPGGIALNNYAANYRVEGNLIWGNFSRFNGGGIGHLGLCLGDNVIRFNTIILNEDFFGALLNQAGDGGGIYIGGDAAGGAGTGNVTINANLIQGNMTGSGHGGGIRAFAVNGADVLASPDPANWHTLNIFNNIIVNNVAGLGGGGISLQDVAKANIINNTIANNDCTSTAALAFTAGALNSTPQPAGVVSAPHSAALATASGQVYANPVLQNNIIWHNRSWYNDASLNGGQGGLAPRPGSPYWDLAVLGSTASADPHLAPSHCLLSALIDPATGFDYNGDPGNMNAAGDPVFVASYENSLQSATVLDEGGNAISVLFTPRTIAGSNYHITGGSPAVLAGDGTAVNDFAELAFDYDAEPRTAAGVDTGADQISEAGNIPVEVIVDNADAGTTAVGSWPTAVFSGVHAADTAFNRTAGDSFTFNATLVPGTTYQVYAWWRDLSNLQTSVPHEIRSNGAVLGTVNVDQTQPGRQWYLLGTYTFPDAAASVTVVSAAGPEYTFADAVRFVPASATPVEVTVDNQDAGTSAVGSWATGTFTGVYGADTAFNRTAGDSFTFNAALVPGESYQVYAWWRDLSNLQTAVPFEIRSNGALLGTVNVDQTQPGRQWYLLGTYTFPDAAASVTVVSAAGPAYTFADAVRFTPAPAAPVTVTVDNQDTQTSQVGAWPTATFSGVNGADTAYNRTAGDSFTFNAALVPGTTYQVQAWWRELSNLQTAVPYEIRSNGAVLETVNVDQTQPGRDWVTLGTYVFPDAAASVTIHSSAGPAYTFADAIRFVPQ